MIYNRSIHIIILFIGPMEVRIGRRIKLSLSKLLKKVNLYNEYNILGYYYIILSSIQIRLLLKSLFIGQYFPPVRGEKIGLKGWMEVLGVLAGCKDTFIREGDNMVQHPRNYQLNRIFIS